MPLAIRNFGHFWNRDDVDWGSPGIPGSLKGYPAKHRKREETDFKDQIGIYVLFDDNREVIYLGQTGSSEKNRMLSRLRDHTRDHLRDRWAYFSWFGFRKVNNNRYLSDNQGPDSVKQVKGTDALNEIEAVLLQLFEPKINKQGPKWGGTEEYLQFIDYDDNEQDQFETINDRLDEIYKKLEER